MIYTTQTPLLRCKLIMFLSEVSVGLYSQCNTKYVRLHLNYQVLGLDLVCWSKVVFVLSGHPMVSMLQYCRLQPALVLAGRGQHLDLIADIVPSSVSWQPSVSTGLAGPLLRQITHNSPLELGIFAPSEIAHCRLNLFKLAWARRPPHLSLWLAALSQSRLAGITRISSVGIMRELSSSQIPRTLLNTSPTPGYSRCPPSHSARVSECHTDIWASRVKNYVISRGLTRPDQTRAVEWSGEPL